MTPSLIRTLEWDTDKVMCSTCHTPWVEHPKPPDIGDYVCIVWPDPKVRVVWWVKEEIRR